MQTDELDTTPVSLFRAQPYRFPIFEQILDLCWSHTQTPPKASGTLLPICPLLSLQSTLDATSAYFSHPSHTLDPLPARVAQVESETESMVDMFKGLLRRDVKQVQRDGIQAYPGGNALVEHAEGILGSGPKGQVKAYGERHVPGKKGNGALTTEEIMMMLSSY